MEDRSTGYYFQTISSECGGVVVFVCAKVHDGPVVRSGWVSGRSAQHTVPLVPLDDTSPMSP